MSKKILPGLLVALSFVVAAVLFLMSELEPENFGWFNLSWAGVIFAGVSGIALLSFDVRIQSHHGHNHIADFAHCPHLGETIPCRRQSGALVPVQRTAFGIKDPNPIAHIILNAFQHRHVPGRRPLIIAHKGFARVRVRPDHADGADLFRV